MADGTGVMLGPVSRLRYSADYGRGGRVVELEGDGYFEVVHDPSRPFAVRTPTAVVRDLGTRFALRARLQDRRLEVVVAEGSVAVGRALPGLAPKDTAADRMADRRALPTDSIVLVPGDLARLADSGRAAVRRGVDVQRYLGWTEGRLVFESAPLPVVVEELERWYDVEIRLASRDLKARVLTATFRDKPINDVLALIAASLDIGVSRSGQGFVLSDR
jgi:transmembrane sensor